MLLSGVLPPEEREIIIRHLRRIDDPEDVIFLQKQHIERTLNEVRDDGFGARFGPEFRPKTSSIAVPVMSNGRIVGCISVIWTRTAMEKNEAISSLVPPLMDLSREIADRLDPSS